ncbi:hypothetical protein BDW02DRAFT_565492 [Decorospora gaudefroyi]|uniref:Uncharacterized protein n=1 Tax=Decorospora gaudefroyi TaxID=184978 RepID=A0A6A5KR34_9PLEO|nr:hypothetical protein BDW02DRAFT_565492 [Decorospora gaudefroyi]
MRRTGLSLVALVGLVTAQTETPSYLLPNNTGVSVYSCRDLSCNFPNTSICASESEDGVPVGVGFAAGAANLSSSASLSYTLATGLEEPGFTNFGIDEYEFSDAQLFVGIDPSLSEDDYPSGCVLMMQYQAQTFPWQDMDPDSPAGRNSTSCSPLGVNCQAYLTAMIMGFNDNTRSSNSSSSDDKCTRLTSYVNTKLQGNALTCGDGESWIANLMNVTGGALPTKPSSNADNLNENLGGLDCYPVKPADYQLNKVAEMRHLYLKDPPTSDADYYSNIFAGLSGFTPVITVLYEDDQKEEVMDYGVQFSCLSTSQPNGEEMMTPFEGAAVAMPRGAGVISVLASLLCVALTLYM